MHHDDLNKLLQLKKNAGSHSPSIQSIINTLGYDPVKSDFCYLSNPYATKLITNRLIKVLDNEKLVRMIESYPADSTYVSKIFSEIEDLNSECIVVGNGAVQCIEWVCDGWGIEKLLIPKPTFSTYYELLENKYIFTEENTIEKNYTSEDLIREAINKKCDSILIIQPNNPTGSHFEINQLYELINNSEGLKIIIDDSFCHYLDNYFEYRKIRNNSNENVVFIKSLAKDFGVAGVRLGYLYSQDKSLLEFSRRKTTWNLNNFAIAISEILSDKSLIQEYWKCRKLFISKKKIFENSLKSINDLNVYKSMANFFLIQSNIFSEKFVFNFLLYSVMYLRTMADKTGLDETFIRIAIRSEEENEICLNELKNYIRKVA